MQREERYRLGRLLARGGSSDVYEAIAIGTERKVALKLLHKDSSLEQSFIKEAHVASKLHHPNIVAILDFGLLEGAPFQVLEHIDGANLAKLGEKSRGSIPVEVGLYIAVELARALEYSHAAGIVHGDVHPQNVLISWTGEVKLADFGAGTRRDRTIDPKTDVGALGMLLIWLLTGKRELDGSIPADIAALLQRRHASARAFGEEASAILASLSRGGAREAARGWASRVRLHLTAPSASDQFDLMLVLQRGGEDRQFEPVAWSKDSLTISTDPGATERDAPDPDPITMVGQVLHGFRIVELVGEGGMGRVYRAMHPLLSREFAVKVLHGAAAKSSAAKVRLSREAQILKQLSHPNNLSLVDFGFTDAGVPFLVVDLLRGRSLSEALLDGPFSAKRAIHIARQIALGIAEAHRAGIVHRDLKPANIFLAGETELVKILDYGIARIINAPANATQLTDGDHLLGTPAFVAPEQIQDPHGAGPPADLYALGLLIHTMIVGRPPFSGPLIEVLHRQLAEPAPPLPKLGGLEKVVAKLLEKSPADRPGSAEEVVYALDRLAAPRPRYLAMGLALLLAASGIASIAALGSQQEMRKAEPLPPVVSPAAQPEVRPREVMRAEESDEPKTKRIKRQRKRKQEKEADDDLPAEPRPRPPPDEDLVKAKLAEVARQLANAPAGEGLEALEDRYLGLRAEAEAADADWSSIAEDLDRLAADIATSRASEAP